MTETVIPVIQKSIEDLFSDKRAYQDSILALREQVKVIERRIAEFERERDLCSEEILRRGKENIQSAEVEGKATRRVYFGAKDKFVEFKETSRIEVLNEKELLGLLKSEYQGIGVSVKTTESVLKSEVPDEVFEKHGELIKRVTNVIEKVSE